MKAEPLKISLNSSTYTAVEIPASYNMSDSFVPVSAYISPDGEWYLSFEETPSEDKPILSGDKYNNSAMRVDKDSNVLFYAKAGVGTPDLIVHFGRPGR